MSALVDEVTICSVVIIISSEETTHINIFDLFFLLLNWSGGGSGWCTRGSSWTRSHGSHLGKSGFHKFIEVFTLESLDHGSNFIRVRFSTSVFQDFLNIGSRWTSVS